MQDIAVSCSIRHRGKYLDMYEKIEVFQALSIAYPTKHVDIAKIYSIF